LSTDTPSSSTTSATGGGGAVNPTSTASANATKSTSNVNNNSNNNAKVAPKQSLCLSIFESSTRTLFVCFAVTDANDCQINDCRQRKRVAGSTLVARAPVSRNTTNKCLRSIEHRRLMLVRCASSSSSSPRRVAAIGEARDRDPQSAASARAPTRTRASRLDRRTCAKSYSCLFGFLFDELSHYLVGYFDRCNTLLCSSSSSSSSFVCLFGFWFVRASMRVSFVAVVSCRSICIAG
jgi:hypothetical protein